MRMFNLGRIEDNHLESYSLAALGGYTYGTNCVNITCDYLPALISDYWRWTYPTDSVTFQYELSAGNLTGSNWDGINFKLIPNKMPLIIGADAIPRRRGRHVELLLLLPNMRIEGSFDYQWTHDTITSGIAWYDHQYGPFLVGPWSNYEWFSAQVDTPGAVLGSRVPIPRNSIFWQIFTDTNQVTFDRTGRILTGRFGFDRSETTSTFLCERTSYFYGDSGGKWFSAGWRMIDSIHDVMLEMTPMIPNSMLRTSILGMVYWYWEGGCRVDGYVNGHAVEGVGFSELPYKRDNPIYCPNPPESVIVYHDGSHAVVRWSPGNAGTYPSRATASSDATRGWRIRST